MESGPKCDDNEDECMKTDSAVGVSAFNNEYENEDYQVPLQAIPIRCDVRHLNWNKLAENIQFDVIIMDPPWQLTGSAPARGVALEYKKLSNKAINEIPIPLLQANGFLFIWVINSRYKFAVELIEKWGYSLVDDIVWIKTTVHRRLAKGHGFYLQHAKETCLIGKKGSNPPNTNLSSSCDIILSERRRQSQKPEELYEMIEKLVPNAKYLEVFAKRHNLRNYWVSIGLEI